MKTLKCVFVLLALFCLSLVGCDNQPVEPLSGSDQSLSKKGGVPGNGNGIKLIEEYDWHWTNDCDLTVDVVGWGQFTVFGPPNNRNVVLGVFHLVWTFTNEETGDTFIWRDVGPDHYYLVGDELFVAVTGRSTASGPTREEINVGHVVLKLDPATEEIIGVELEAGRNLGLLDDLACGALK